MLGITKLFHNGDDFKYSVLIQCFFLILLIIFLIQTKKNCSRAKIYFKADVGSSRILKFEKTNLHYDNNTFRSITSFITQQLKKLEALRGKIIYYQI